MSAYAGGRISVKLQINCLLICEKSFPQVKLVVERVQCNRVLVLGLSDHLFYWLMQFLRTSMTPPMPVYCEGVQFFYLFTDEFLPSSLFFNTEYLETQYEFRAIVKHYCRPFGKKLARNSDKNRAIYMTEAYV